MRLIVWWDARHLMRMFVFHWLKTDNYCSAGLVGETTRQIFLASQFKGVLESSGRKLGGLAGRWLLMGWPSAVSYT